MNRSGNAVLDGVVLIAIVFTLGLFAPLVAVLSTAMSGGFQEVFLGSRVGYYMDVLGFSLWQAGLSTIGALLLGLPGAWLLARRQFPGRRMFRGLTVIPFVLPPVLMVLGVVLVFGNNGAINRVLGAIMPGSGPVLRILYSPWAIVVAHALYEFPIISRLVAERLETLDPGEEEAARLLGASRSQVARQIILPEVIPSILSASSLVFLLSLLSFVIPLVLGGGPASTTLEVEIYRLARIDVETSAAAALAILQSGAALAVVGILLKVAGTRRFAHQSLRRPPQTRVRVPAQAYLALVVLLIGAPLGSVLVRSLRDTVTRAGGLQWTLDGYARAAELSFSLAASLVTAIAVSLLTAFLATVLSHAASRRRMHVMYGLFAVAPLAISSIVLSLGYLRFEQLLGRGVHTLVLAQSAVALPFALRALMPVFDAQPRHAHEAARMLGADALQATTHIDLGIALPSVLGTAAFAFGISMGEVSAAIMLAPPDWQTLPLTLYRLMAGYEFTAAAAVGVILMTVSFLSFMVFDRLGEHGGLQ